jgi:hypothetical protein
MRTNIMTSTTDNVTWTGRTWQIVRSDLDLAHVFPSQNTISFEPATRHGAEGYKIAHSGESKTVDLSDTFLVSVGTHRPAFHTITKKKELPLFSKDSESEYADVADVLASYTERNREMQRLEGVIKIHCHDHASKHVTDHAPMSIKTLVHVYQFGNVVKGDRPLLVVRAPLSPVCPSNGDGTVLGYA